MKNALVVLNYNDYETTASFLNKIKDYKILDLIVVVDNNSTDNSYKELLKIKNGKIDIIKAFKNGGYGYGNNIGIKHAIEKLGSCNIIVSNPDIVVKENVIKKLFKDLNKDNKYAIVGPVINTHGKISRAFKITNGFEEMIISIPKIGTKLKEKIIAYKDSYYKEELNEVDCVSGCFFAFKSDVFEKINFYDEGLFLYYEEMVISKKVKELGYKVMFDNTVEIIHNHSVTIDKNHSKLNKYRILNESKMYYLNNYTNAIKLTKKLIKIFSKIMIKHYNNK